MALTSDQFLLPLAISPFQSTMCGVAKPICLNSQLGSCHCLAKKSYDCPRSIKKDPGSSKDFGGLLQTALCLAGGVTSRMIQMERSFGLNKVLLQQASPSWARASNPPNTPLATQDALFCAHCASQHSVFTVWNANPLLTHYTDPSQYQDPIPSLSSVKLSKGLCSVSSLFRTSLKQCISNGRVAAFLGEQIHKWRFIHTMDYNTTVTLGSLHFPFHMHSQSFSILLCARETNNGFW